MSDQDFFFTIDVSGDPTSGEMLDELARTVLGQVKLAGAEALTAELHAAIAPRTTGKARCEVRFRAAAGQLEVVVSGAGLPEWRTTRPLPAS